jgi:sterol desaturase/sphingolipid hydroxylase (fatty acid hydroxylase superfamily)
MIDQWIALLLGLDRKLMALAAWLAIAVVLMVPLERFFFLRRQKVLRDDFLQDLFYFFFSGTFPAFVLVVTHAVVMHVLRAALPAAWFQWMGSLPISLRVVLIVAVSDFAYYWAHRWAHEVPLFWRVHAIHHSPTQLDWLVATRAHPLEIAYLRTLTFVPVFALGLVDLSGAAQGVLLLAVAAFNTVWGIFIHANVRWRLSWLERWLSTPRFHHWHHADDGASVANKNYAALLPIWDRCFGSLHLPEYAFPSSYGSTTALPGGTLRQLLFPFRPGR